MAFFRELGEKVGKAAQTAAKKSNELVETTKVNMSINSEEEKIQKLFKQIGELIFEDFKNNTDTGENVVDLCKQIVTHEQAIKELKEKLMVIKNIKPCPNCGAEVEAAAPFCPKCGAKQEEPEVTVAEEDDRQKCPSCNAEYDEGTVFCSNCGNKLVE